MSSSSGNEEDNSLHESGGNEKEKLEQQSSEETAWKEEDDESETPVDKVRVVRFPYGNDIESDMIYMPKDEPEAEPRPDTFSPARSKFSTRRQSLQPVKPGLRIDTGIKDENSNGRPANFLVHSNGSRLLLARRESESFLSTVKDRRRSTANNQNLRDHIPEDSKNSVFDIGLITSGGLAPGPGRGENDSRLRRSFRNSFRLNRDRDRESTIGHHRPQASTTSAASHGSNHNDIPIHELHRRLSKIAQSDEEAQNKRSSAYFARNLVRHHAGHFGDHRESPHPNNGMTRPVTSYFDTREHEEDDSQTRAEEPVPEMMMTPESRESSNNDSRPDPTVPPTEDYIPAPAHVHQGVLGSLLKLYGQSHHQQHHNHHHDSTFMTESTDVSGACTPVPGKTFDYTSDGTENDEKEFRKESKAHEHSESAVSLSDMYYSTSHSTVQFAMDYPNKVPRRPRRHKKKLSALEMIRRVQERKRLEEEEAAITIHIADVLQRQRFILRLCRALMMYGAPTHRLEEYMKMTSRALSIDGQFLYIPGCMIISFGDSSTHTSEMQLVRCIQGVNLCKLNETHQIYKDVIHGYETVDEALIHIEDLLLKKNLYPPWLCVLFFGFSSLAVGPFAFRARWVDMPISFLLGSLVGLLQIVVAPRSSLYNNVFEVTAAILVSFLGRAFGSIGAKEDLFCFAAISQSALALILPGYIILCGSLELQARSIVAGSVRMFYAIIYSLLLGFGITLGAAIYGWIDSSATSSASCPAPLNDWWRFLFVPMFTVGLALVNQAHWKQIPIMIVISGSGYVVTYFSNKRLQNASELTSAIGAFVIGILGNMYSRVGHGLAFAAMLPAIFVQVPSGVAAQGSLIQGIANANNIVAPGSSSSQPTQSPQEASNYYGTVASLGITMVQVSIGITVGLFVATLAIYPFGKKRSGLFTF